MNDCLFCKIVDKKIPSKIIYEDDDVLVIHDAFPTSLGHCLVISKKHFDNFLQCDKKTTKAFTNAIQKVGKAILKSYGLGLNILSNVNKEAGQSIMHAHVHLIPVNSDGHKAEIKFSSLENVDFKTIVDKIKANI